MTYLCFTDIVESGSCRNDEFRNAGNIQYPFLQYAARNWYRHLEKEDINKFARLISRLTEPKSPALLTWGAVNGITNLEGARDTWEVALKVNIPWLVDLQIDSTVITKEMVEKAAANGMTEYDYLRRLVKKHDTLFTEDELCLVVEYLDHALAHQILSGHNSTVMTQTVFEAAATNVKYGRLVIEVILDLSTCFIITAEFIRLAQKNDVNGKDIIRLVIDNHNLEIAEEAVQQTVAGGDIDVVKSLFKREQLDGLQLALGSAVKQGNYDLLNLVLDKGEDEITITENYLQDLVNSSRPDDLKTFLRAHEEKPRITESIIIDTANHEEKREYLLLFFLKERGEDFQITEEILEAIIPGEDLKNEALKFLLEERSHEIHMTEGIWKAAAANRRSYGETIRLLIDIKGHELLISEEILRSAAENLNCGHRILKQFLVTKKDDARITEAILKESLGNAFHTLQIENVLKEAQRHGIWINTEEMMRIAAKSKYGNSAMQALLATMKEDEVRITEKVLKEVARNESEGAHEIMGYILRLKDDRIQITEDVLIEATRNPYGYAIMGAIFLENDPRMHITEKLLKMMLEMNTDTQQMSKLIASTKYVDINITEEVLIDAAINGNNVHALGFLFDVHRDKIEITEKAVKAAIGTKHSCHILSVISKFKGKQVQITDEIKDLMSAEQLECWYRPGKYPLSSPRPVVGHVEDVDKTLDSQLVRYNKKGEYWSGEE